MKSMIFLSQRCRKVRCSNDVVRPGHMNTHVSYAVTFPSLAFARISLALFRVSKCRLRSSILQALPRPRRSNPFGSAPFLTPFYSIRSLTLLLYLRSSFIFCDALYLESSGHLLASTTSRLELPSQRQLLPLLYHFRAFSLRFTFIGFLSQSIQYLVSLGYSHINDYFAIPSK